MRVGVWMRKWREIGESVERREGRRQRRKFWLWRRKRRRRRRWLVKRNKISSPLLLSSLSCKITVGD
ncbi:hypothetical protein LINPERHAP2_LOCUS43114 [Linum perenne]